MLAPELDPEKGPEANHRGDRRQAQNVQDGERILSLGRIVFVAKEQEPIDG
jgi:hypothetical protein